MEFAVLNVHVAMIIAMPSALAVAIPAPMLGPMIAFLIAMIFAMDRSTGTGRMKVAVILPDVAMIFAVATTPNIVAVACLLNLLDVRSGLGLPGLTLGIWSALDAFEPLEALDAHRARIALTTLLRMVVRRIRPVCPSLEDTVGLTLAVLCGGGHRHHCACHQHWNPKPTHRLLHQFKYDLVSR